MKIGILREGKIPPDERVPLTPKQCKLLMGKYPELEIKVQPSEIRTIKNEEYKKEGITLQESLDDCDIIMGVKEVPISSLIPEKKYFFFSHTIKKQPYNRNLLRRLLELKIELIDYETLTYKNGARVLGFGRFAGLVGAYNGFLGFGLKSGNFSLTPAHKCSNINQIKEELKKVRLDKNFKIVLTGKGRVGRGANEILTLLGLREISPKAFLNIEFDEPVYTRLDIEDYLVHKEGLRWNSNSFFKDPSNYISIFPNYAKKSNMYIACHYWEAPAPFLFTKEDAKSKDFKIDLIADISCDIDGPVASTIRSSTIDNPFYGYDPQSEKEVGFNDDKAIGVMAVDNLPCELPRDASEGFGQDLCDYIFPALLGDDEEGIIERAAITRYGKLTKNFTYLQDYVEGKDIK